MTPVQFLALALLLAFGAAALFIPVIDDGQFQTLACDSLPDDAPGALRDCQMMDVGRAVVERSK